MNIVLKMGLEYSEKKNSKEIRDFFFNVSP